MATTAELMRRIEIDLRAVAAEVEFLPELEQGWSDEPTVNRIDWEMEWRDLMGRLQSLHKAYLSRAMTAEQVERYRELACHLKDVLPIVQRLGLALPPIPLQEVK